MHVAARSLTVPFEAGPPGGRRTLLSLAAVLAVFAVGALGPSPVVAQVEEGGGVALVRGVLVDSAGGMPVSTGAVRLLGGEGAVLRTVISDVQGRFSVPVAAPGTYRLRAERIGYVPQERGPLTLAAGDTVAVEIRMTAAPLLGDSLLAIVRRTVRPLRAGEQLIFGRLIDDISGGPIVRGTIRLLTRYGSIAVSTVTDGDGRFHFVSPRVGTYQISGEAFGYETSVGPEMHIMLGDSIGMDFYLSPDAVLLNPITVTASARPMWDRAPLVGMEEFMDRYARYSRAGLGEFLTRDSIAKLERYPLASVGHMLLMSMPWVVAEADIVGPVKLRRCGSTRYYLNGFPVPYDAVSGIPPEFLEGVEVSGCRVGYWTRVSPYENPPTRTIWTVAGVGAALAGLILLLY